MKLYSTRKITRISILTAIATVLFYIGDFSIIPGFPHLKISLSDIPAAIAAVTMGPMAGVMVELFKNILHLFKTDTFAIGEFINFIVGSALIVPFGIIFRKIKDRYNSAVTAIISIAPSALCTMIVGALANYLLFPVYFKMIGMEPNDIIIMGAVASSFMLNFLKALVTLIPVVIFSKRILKYIGND